MRERNSPSVLSDENGNKAQIVRARDSGRIMIAAFRFIKVINMHLEKLKVSFSCKITRVTFLMRIYLYIF